MIGDTSTGAAIALWIIIPIMIVFMVTGICFVMGWGRWWNDYNGPLPFKAPRKG